MNKIFALVLVMVLLIPGVAFAQGEIDISWSLNQSSASPQLHRNTWNRLEVTVTNGGSADLEGEVTVGYAGVYRQDIFVEAGKASTVVFYLAPSSSTDHFLMRSRNPEITVTQRGREVAWEAVRVSQAFSPEQVYIGVVSQSPENFRRLTSIVNHTSVHRFDPNLLDNPLYLQNYRMIIFSDTGTFTMNEVQKQNLRNWVEGGGVLVIGGGSSWQQNLSLLPANLSPAQPRDLAMVLGSDMDFLPIKTQAQYPVAVAAISGETIVQAGDYPILAKNALGRGAVFWSALDLESAPLDSGANFEAFWQSIVREKPLVPDFFGDMNWTIPNIFSRLISDGLASALSPGRLLLVLLIYIALAGPVNFLVLKRIGRKELAWVTIPILSIVFTAGAFAAGSLSRGNERILYQLNLVRVQTETIAEVSSFGGVFVPGRGTIRLTGDVLGLAASQEGSVTFDDQGGILEYNNPPLWSVQRFLASDMLTMPGGVSFSAKVTSESLVGRNGLSLKVSNDTGLDLFDAYIRLNNGWYKLGPLETGEEKEVSVVPAHMLDIEEVLGRYSQVPGRSYHSRHWFEIENILPSGPVVFLGFGDTGLMDLTGGGKSVTLNILTKSLDLDVLEFSPGTFDLPQGFITAQLLSAPSVHNYGHGTEYFFEGQGDIDFVFEFPENLDPTQGQFTLHMDNFWGGARGAVYAYNHVQDKWQELGGLENLLSRGNSTLSLDEQQELISNQQMLLRITYDGNVQIGAGRFSIAIKGGLIHD